MIEMMDQFEREGRTYRLFFHSSAARHGFTPTTACAILSTMTHFKRNGPDPNNQDRIRVAVAGFNHLGHFLEMVVLELAPDEMLWGELHIIHINTPSKRVMDFLSNRSNALPWFSYGQHK